jgi:hypothetical protein
LITALLQRGFLWKPSQLQGVLGASSMALSSDAYADVVALLEAFGRCLAVREGWSQLSDPRHRMEALGLAFGQATVQHAVQHKPGLRTPEAVLAWLESRLRGERQRRLADMRSLLQVGQGCAS